MCFVCGGQGAQYSLHSRSREQGPYFPFLEQHEPPRGAFPVAEDGTVKSCSLCYSFLNQQWETYERNRTPHRKRLYWLKRNDSVPFIGLWRQFLICDIDMQIGETYSTCS